MWFIWFFIGFAAGASVGLIAAAQSSAARPQPSADAAQSPNVIALSKNRRRHPRRPPSILE